MKAPKIVNFRDKITLCKIVSTVDSELNRVSQIVPVNTVWAVVEAKSSNVDDTDAGYRPEIHYEIIIRKQAITCDCIQWHGKSLQLTAPWYAIDEKYIMLKAVEVIGYPTEIA